MREDEKRIVLGSKRFVTNTDNPVWLQVPLVGEIRDMVEGDRTILINQQTQFEEERQESTIFRISGKIVNLFDNVLSGYTQYAPYKNSLYYTNNVNNAISNVINPNSAWEGYPQFYEFTFFREVGIDGHVPFVGKSASSYNWMTYVSYPFSSDTTQKMSWTSEQFGVTNTNFTVSDGIPFVIDNGTLNGKELVYFYCATNHNLKIGNFIEINLPLQPNGISNKKIFQVYSLGDGSYGTEKYVFTIFNMKFPQNETQVGTYGNFKRIINIDNSGETKSRYYIRLHKTLTDIKDFNVFKAGFDKNAFIAKSKIEYSALTPNNVQRVSIKEDNQNYSFSFSKDVDISELIDNNGKPLTELFLTIINRGYMGYFNPPATTQTGTPTGLDIGWGFNFLKNDNDTWWDHTSTLNKDELPLSSYNVNSQNFYYNESLPQGSVIKGDFCEYNDFEQVEYLLSPCVHKYSFNPTLLWDSSPVTYPSGYFYNPHHGIKIRVFSDYIESAPKKDADGVPDYAWFSEIDQTFYWKDLYSYGFIDGEGNGVDYPFINGSHTIFNLLLFKQYPSKRNVFVETTQINTIQTDNCE
jgi:hypothetical protein